MRVKFWGTRGSTPSPLAPEQIEEKICRVILGLPDLAAGDESAVRAYVRQLSPLLRGTAGGNTACVQVQAQAKTLIIDAGSGLRRLSQELMNGPSGQGQAELHLFISHLHWDHIQGFPFFTPAFIPGNRIFIYGVHDVQQALEEQQRYRHFPVSLSDMHAERQFVRLQEGQAVSIGPVRVSTLKNRHPGDSYSLRIEDQHSVLVYASDVEYKDLTKADVQRHVDFFKDADVLIFDAQYTLKESWLKEDWGHSSAMIGVDLARAAGVKRLVLFHHDPTYSDDDLEAIRRTALDYQAQDKASPACEISVAYEGLELDLTPPRAISWQIAPEAETAVLTPAHIFDEGGVEQLAHQLEQWAAQATGSIIDLSQVETLTTASLKALVRLGQEKPIVLAAPSPSVQEILELAGYLDFFAVYPSVQAALAAVQAREALDLPGQVVQKRYQIQARLGSSPLGVSIKATDTQSGSPVVLKILSPCFSLETLERFMRQARQVLALDHPNIARVWAWEQDGVHTFQVAEWIDGQTLHDVLAAGQLPGEQAMDIAVEVTRALEYAHSRGLVHTNLKPHNIFLLDGSVKLSDFGLGRLVEGRNLLESPLLFLDPLYLAPEQILGQPLDARTDLYALGVILYQLLTGCPPFEGSPQGVMRAHLQQDPLPPRELNPRVSLSLEHLVLKLLAKNPNDRYASAQQARHVSDSLVSRADEASPLRQVLVVGRESQLETLHACWQEAQAGRGQLVFVTGEQGIGKTTLALQAAARSRPPVLLVGRCRELAGNPAYYLFSQVLGSYIATVPPELFDEQAGQSLGYLIRLAPQIHTMRPALSEPPPLEPEQEQLRLMSYLAQFIKRATQERPWFVILDDLQWADAGSLEVLRYLGRHVPAMAMLVVGTYRDVELERGHPLLKALQDVSRHPAYHHFPLDRLDEEGVGHMLSHLWQQDVPHGLVQKIYQHTGGNPFYVEEVARGLLDEGLVRLQAGEQGLPAMEEVRLPASMHETVWRRIGHLDPETQGLLRQAAVLGLTFKFDDLRELCALPEWQLLEHLDVALERQLVQEVPGDSSLRFRHAEIQRVLYEDLGPLRRRVLHRQVAEALERRYWPNTAHIAEELAHHFYQAGHFERAMAYSLQAGRQAQIAYAAEPACLWYQRTLDMLEQLGPDKVPGFDAILVSTRQSLGEVLALMSRYDEALDQYTLVQMWLESLPPDASRARWLADLYRQIAHIHERRSEYDLALTWLSKGLGCLDQDEPTPELMRIYRLTGRVYLQMGDYQAARTHLERALALAQPCGLHEVEADSLLALGLVAWHLGDAGQTGTCGQQALDIAREIGDRQREAAALNTLGLARLEQDVGARDYFERALSICREIGDRHLEGMLLNNLGLVAYYAHDYLAAKACLEQALRHEADAGHRHGEGLALVSLGNVYGRLGVGEQAQACYERSLDIFRELGSWSGEGEVLAALGWLYHQLGDDLAACRNSQQALSIAQDLGMLNVQGRALVSLGQAWAGLGRLADAEDAYRQVLALQPAPGLAPKIAALAGLASVHLAQARPDQALAFVEEILESVQPEEGQALYAVAEPAWVYLVCVRVLQARQAARAGQVLAAAHGWLQERARGLDETTRRSFLDNVPAQRDILRAWESQA